MLEYLLKDLDYPKQTDKETFKKIIDITTKVFNRVYKRKTKVLQMDTAQKNLKKYIDSKDFDFDDDFKERVDKDDYPGDLCDF